MIVFDKFWKLMEKREISTYQLRESYGIDSKTVRKLRKNKIFTTATLSKLCAMFECKLEDIAEYIPDPLEEEDNE